ncbi:MAG: hypothetical protein ACC645_18610, partial [Pirellulales bacterium]
MRKAHTVREWTRGLRLILAASTGGKWSRQAAEWLLVAWLTVALWPAPAVGLQIDLTFDKANSDNPDYDPNGIRLGQIVNYVASVFEDIIEDPHTLELTYEWDVNLQEDKG